MYGSHIEAIKSPSRTIIAYDRRCAGASSYTIDRYFDIETIAMDCVMLVRALGFSQATVVGTSMGGPVALWIAINQPRFCEKLVILNSHPQIVGPYPPYDMTEKREKFLMGMLAMSPGEQRNYFDVKGHAEKMRQRTLVDVDRGGGSLESLRKTIAALSDDELFTFWAGSNHNQFAYLGVDLTTDMGSIVCPTLIVHGDADDVVPFEGATLVNRAVAGSELCVIKGAKHGIAGNAQCQYAVNEWLDTQEAASRKARL
jgi:pimeloyl-ACP methyl ester carboxylesterase